MTGLGALATALLAPAVYWRMLVPGWAPVGFDYIAYFYPYRHYLAQAWAAHRWIPLWDPSIYLGVPYLANIQNAALYPLSLVFAVLPTPAGLAWTLVIHLAIAGSGMFAYAHRSERLRLVGSAVAALTFMFSGPVISRLEFPNQISTLAWAPWLMLAVDRLVVRPRPRLIAACAALVALILLAGHTQQAYFCFLLAVMAAAGRLWTIGRRRRWRALARGAAAGATGAALGAGVAAAQLLPTLGLLHQSIRATGLTLRQAGVLGLPLGGIVGSLLPDYLNQQSSEMAGYVGVAALFLAALALVTRPRRSRVLFLLALGIAAVWAAIGIRGHLFDLLFRFLPGLALFRVPARLQVFSAVALALMAGHGARAAAQLAIASRRARWRRRSWAGVGLAGLLTALPTLGIYAARFVAQPTPRLWKAFPRPYPDLDLVGLAAFTVAAVVIAGAVLAAGTRRLRWAPLWALPALVFAELFVAGSNTEQRHPLPDLIYRQPVTAQSLLPAGPGHRYLALLPAVPVPLPKTLASYRLTAADRAHFEFLLTWRSALRPNVGMGAAHLTADGYDGGILPLDGYVRFRKPLLPPASGNRPDFTDSTLTSTVWHPSWLGLTGTAVVLTARSADPNPPGCARCLVRARVLGNVAAWRPAGAARPTRAWLETGSGRVAARITSDEGERVTVAVPGAKGTLVLADAYYPGWTATADGRPVTIRKYAGFLRSVRVPAGTHTVTFQFRPARVIAGVAISLIALLAVLLLAIVPWHRLQAQRRSGPAQPPSDA